MTTPAVGQSTVPAAITALKAHMDAVADASSLDVSTHVGQIISGVKNNFLCLGDPNAGSPLLDAYQATPQENLVINQPMPWWEQYSLLGRVRAFTPGSKSLARLTDAFALIAELRARLASDRQAPCLNGGWWFVADANDLAIGRLDGQATGVVLQWRVDVQQATFTA